VYTLQTLPRTLSNQQVSNVVRTFTNSQRVANYVQNLVNRGDTIEEAVITALKYFFGDDIDKIPRYKK